MSKWIYSFKLCIAILVLTVFSFNDTYSQSNNKGLTIGEGSYFEMPGLNVLVYNNTFAEGHQSGVEIIQHGVRVATNGELRLSPSPGQWQPLPKLGTGYEARGVSPQGVELEGRFVDKENNIISLPCSYPNESRNRKGFNPIIYPDLEINYEVKVKAEGKTFTITVDLDKPIPEEWQNRVGYILELFPGDLYGKTYFMDDSAGVFARQAHGPIYFNETNEAEQVPFAAGKKLVVAPEDDKLRMTIESKNSTLQLLDGSFKHNNGWFVVRTLIPAGATKGAVQWKISPNVIPGWIDPPVIHLSQVGYHPKQTKTVYIELDKNDKNLQKVSLLKLEKNGTTKTIKDEMPAKWGRYLRYEYATLDFTDVREEGIYMAKYGDFTSNVFSINKDVYKGNIWQPTLEYFVPIQMCHMRVNQKYRVWHGVCHLDDALMMPLNVRHFDGYNNEEEISTLSKYKPLEHVPGLNVGGWHDAGDYDLRIESQAQTVIALALTYEEFGIDYDATYVDQKNRHVELHQPDGKPDILQQVEHGVLAILSGYRSMGQFYRGIIAPSLRQYVHLGDASTHTDNKVCDDKLLKEAAKKDELWYKKVANINSNVFDPALNHAETEVVVPGLDDRLVFMETNPGHKLIGATALAIASRVLKEYNPDLAKECIQVAEIVWDRNKDADISQGRRRRNTQKIQTLIELVITTEKQEYKDQLCEMNSEISAGFMWTAPSFGRVLEHIDCQAFKDSVNAAALASKPMAEKMMAQSPFGSRLGGAEYSAFSAYYLHKYWPDLYPAETLFKYINYLLGCRPGSTTGSLISGVGVNSPTVAYGTNRADWSYIPGGTFWAAVNLVNPDLAEDKNWPFLWQEREYIITAPCYFMFAVIGADRILENM
ncbi:MAG: glycoside hydrolase family 9 protein [Calditrichaceae bacterium]|nr:glycoside hydrolase family 9 protein [Calditrichaceae bacterium]